MADIGTTKGQFRQNEREIEKIAISKIREQTTKTRSNLYSISEKYNNGEPLSANQVKQLNREIRKTTKVLTGTQIAAVTIAMNANADNMYLGSVYSYSKASNTYLDYKLLTKRQKAISRLDKIKGQTYVDRLKFHSDNLNKRTAAIIQNGVRLGFSNQQIASNISKQMNINYKHSLTIARTETGRMGSLATQKAREEALEQGLKFNKTWRQYASKDPRHDHSKMEGKTIPADELFVLPSGATCPEPRLSGNAADDINCHCEAIESFEGFEPTTRRQGREIVEIPDYDVWYKSRKGRQT